MTYPCELCGRGVDSGGRTMNHVYCQRCIDLSKQSARIAALEAALGGIVAARCKLMDIVNADGSTPERYDANALMHKAIKKAEEVLIG